MTERKAERLLGVSERAYFRHDYPDDRPCLSQSMAAILRKCPAEAFAKHPKLGANPFKTLVNEKATTAQTLGVAVERFLQTGGDGIELVNFKTFQSAVAKAARDRALGEGKLPLTTRAFKQACSVATIAAERLRVSGIVLTGDSQVVYIWPRMTSRGQIWCRMMADHVIVPSTGQIDVFDLKCTKSAEHDDFARSVVDYGYHIQRAAYVEGIRAFHGADRPIVYRLIIVEPKSMAVNVAVRHLSPEMVLIGEEKWGESCELWAKCVRGNLWPGYGLGEQNGPYWYLAQYQDLLR
jgi:hypothetical protein